MIKQYQYKAEVNDLCKWLTFPRSNYYYAPSDGKRGFKPSMVTLQADGSQVSNAVIIEEIKMVLSGEFVCYGYQKVTIELKNRQYIINHKKVYRLMDESNLLLGKVIKTNGKRQWVKHRKIEAQRPMEYLCLDIKYIWVEGEKRNYYLLTILDIFTRKTLDWILQRSVRKMDVINMFRRLDTQYGIRGVNVRNDNGSQFIANDVRQFLRVAEANQEFTHIATPEENAYIEAFHSILQTEVVERFEFAGYYEAKQTIAAYMDFYTHKRLHGRIGYKTPQQMWDEYEKKNNTFASSGEAEAVIAGGQPARNNLMDGDVSESEGVIATPSTPKVETSLSFMPQTNSNTPTQNNLNHFEKDAQTMGG
jgi:putative transposase